MLVLVATAISLSLWVAEIQEHSMGVTTVSLYNNGRYLSLGSMNSLNVKVIHTGGIDPTLLSEKLKHL